MMSAGPASWLSLQRGRRVEVLDLMECRRLLASVSIGWLGYAVAGGLRVVPSSFALIHNALFFRTAGDGEVARWGLGREVCFEVQHVGEFLHAGSSILVVGRMKEHSPAVADLDVWDMTAPCSNGSQSLLVEVPLTRVTGRRVHAT